MGDPVHEQTIETVKEDVEWAKTERHPRGARGNTQPGRRRSRCAQLKTDVSARVGDYVDEKKQAVKDKFTGVRDAVTGTASKAVPSGERVGRVKDTAERNPIGLAVGAAAVGFIAGLLIPSTQVENERMGEMSDRLVDAAKETAGDAVERGKQVAQEAAETAKESGREQSQELASNLQDRVQESAGSSSQSAPAQ